MYTCLQSVYMLLCYVFVLMCMHAVMYKYVHTVSLTTWHAMHASIRKYYTLTNSVSRLDIRCVYAMQKSSPGMSRVDPYIYNYMYVYIYIYIYIYICM